MISLVTGANGHLGNNIVRHLISKGEQVKAGVRNTNNTQAFRELDCEIVHADLLQKDTLLQALDGVNILYQVGAVFKRWAKDPMSEIIAPNLKGTQNILEAAAEMNVKKVVYISSVSALDPSIPFDGNTWNNIGKENPYTYSKVIAEKSAHELGEKLGLDISYILPTAIIGANFFNLTPTLELFANIFNKQLPFALPFRFMMVDAESVAEASWLAAANGKPGERYVISAEKAVSVTDLFLHLQNQFPGKNYKVPGCPPKALFFFLAWLGGITSRFSGKPPVITIADAKEFWGADPAVNLLKAKDDLGFEPVPIELTLTKTFNFLSNDYLNSNHAS